MTTLRRINVTLSAEVLAALDYYEGNRSDKIERALWRDAAVRTAAKRLGLKRPERKRVGRPAKT